MRFDPALPVAVFLGPSLAQDEARALLPANYYPPVRMGDVYRLLASGVETIAIIDGVFHQTTPVWQREILCALEEGIRVVGGASMGALRAAELAPYGMEGVGTIFGWYRDGHIDGDDEVALRHADESAGFRALSEPLVNLRHNLARARARELLSAPEHDALLAVVAQRYFADRSWRLLRESAPYAALPAERRDALTRFLGEHAEDLKALDARAVLATCAATTAPRASPPAAAAWSYQGTLRPFRQSLLAADGSLVSGEALLREGGIDASEWAALLRDSARRFLLLDWMQRHGLAAAPAYRAAWIGRWRAEGAGRGEPAWCRANGLTGTELEAALARRADVDWLLEHGADHLAGDPRHAPLLRCPARARHAADWFLACWAQEMGIRHPEGATTTADDDQSRLTGAAAVAGWVLAKEPAHFGYLQWSGEADALEDLKLAGRGAELAARIRAATATATANGEARP